MVLAILFARKRARAAITQRENTWIAIALPALAFVVKLIACGHWRRCTAVAVLGLLLLTPTAAEPWNCDTHSDESYDTSL